MLFRSLLRRLRRRSRLRKDECGGRSPPRLLL